MVRFTPAPGSYIAEEIKKESLVLVDENKTQLACGKVIAVGEPDWDEGKFIESPVKVGDTAYFLSYAGDYDWTKIDGVKYYTVLRGDHRFVLKK